MPTHTPARRIKKNRRLATGATVTTLMAASAALAAPAAIAATEVPIASPLVTANVRPIAPTTLTPTAQPLLAADCGLPGSNFANGYHTDVRPYEVNPAGGSNLQKRTIVIAEGDRVQFAGAAAACQGGTFFDLIDHDSLPVFFKRAGAAYTDVHVPTAAEFIREGSGVRTQTVLGPFSAADAAFTWGFGAYDDTQVHPPEDDIDTYTGASTVSLKVATPAAAIAQEVCVYSGRLDAAALCDADDPAAWAKEALVPAGAEVHWRTTFVNTGNTALTDVSFRASTDPEAVHTVVAPGDSIPAGGHASVIYTSPGPDEAGMIASSTVDLTANVVDPTSRTAFGPGQTVGERYGVDPITATDTASARTIGPALSLAIQTCVAGSDCDPDVDSDWTDDETIPYDSTATWRLLLRNIGDTDLGNVAVTSSVLSGGASDDAFAPCLLDAADLPMGASAHVVCTTDRITGTAKATVNTVRATGTARDSEGSVIPAFGEASVHSNTDSASVITLQPEVPVEPEIPVDPETPVDPTIPTTTAPAIPLPGVLALTGGGMPLALLALGAPLLIGGSIALLARTRLQG